MPLDDSPGPRRSLRDLAVFALIVFVQLTFAQLACAQSVANYGFESGTLSSWTVENGATANIVTSTFHSGSYSAVTTGASNAGLYQAVSGLIAGQQYVVSAWVNVTAYQVAALYANDSVTNATAELADQGTTNGWQYISLPFTADSTGIVGIHLWSAGSGTIYWDDVSVARSSDGTISGQVLAGGSGLPGVTVTLTGTTPAGISVSLSTTTDSNGNYSFTVSAGGTYVETPSLAGYTFNPASQTFTDVTANQSAAVMISTFNITGRWNQASQYPATWNLTQQGNTVIGTASSTVCGTITWQASGRLINANTGEYQLIATNPSAATDLCGNEAASQQTEDLTLSANNNTGWSLDESVFSSGTVSGESTWTKAGSTDTVQISSSPGVPLNGTTQITVTANSLPITLTVNTETGSGYAAFGLSSGGLFDTTITINQSPEILYVHGFTVSSTADNISITATSSTNPNQYQKIYLTVVSVALALRNTPGQSLSPNDTASVNFVSAYGSTLGPHVVPNAPGNPPYCAEVIEYVGTVTPSNYRGVIALTRVVTYAQFAGSSPAGSKTLQKDTSPAGVMVSVPNQGQIFDLDAPGQAPDATVTARTRQNFIESASLDNSSGPVLAAINTFARTSCGAVNGNVANPQFVNDVTGDNTSGTGSTKLTWNLQ